MEQYLRLLENISTHGTDKKDRTGVGTRSLFGHQLKFDLGVGKFPLITTKKIFWRGLLGELLWIISGNTNIKLLQDQNIHIWDAWADSDGDLGPVYGHQLRKFHKYPATGAKAVNAPINIGPYDQLSSTIEGIKTNPDSRRHIISLWNIADLEEMALPPCHGVVIQFYVADGKLSCQMYQRSADVFLGLPWNIASYACLTHMIAQVVGLKLGTLVITLGDAHIYSNHVDQVTKQLMRTPKDLPTLALNPDIKDIDSFKISDFTLTGYDPYPSIKGEVAV